MVRAGRGPAWEMTAPLSTSSASLHTAGMTGAGGIKALREDDKGERKAALRIQSTGVVR